MRYPFFRLFAVIPLALLPAWGADTESGRILVVADRSVPALAEAADALKRGMADQAGRIVEATPESAGSVLGTGKVAMAVAVGASARSSLATGKADVPVVSTMVSLADIAAETTPLAKPAGTVYLDLDFTQVALETARMFPDKKRLGLIVTSRKEAPSKAVLAKLSQQGLQVPIVVSAGKANLLEAFRELRGKIDILLCLPDSRLFDSTSIPPLLRASLEDQVPVVGYSASFVRAGAVAGVIPDYGEIGVQTAAMVRRVMTAAGQDGGDETPRKVTSMTNPTVLRLLGWKLSQVSK